MKVSREVDVIAWEGKQGKRGQGEVLQEETGERDSKSEVMRGKAWKVKV